MPWGYICLKQKSPRSFLFAIVTNVGPLAIAYRQGNDCASSPLSRVGQVAADTLRLIEILSDPANRAALEAERALAERWYWEQEGNEPIALGDLPSVPDSPQPSFFPPKDRRWCWGEQQHPQPELPWGDDAPREFPFTTTCLLSGLLRDDTTNGTRPGDVQLQPLSTVFRGHCTEYGLVILDISDLDHVAYGIVGFPVRYMADVWYGNTGNDWDPVEDSPPDKEPDIVLGSPQPRVPLSILQWIRKYLYFGEENPDVRRLEEKPLVDAGALDYIWPPELVDQPEPEDQLASAPSPGVLSSITDYFWPSKSTTRAKDEASAAEDSTISKEPPRNAIMDRAIDNLLILTQDAADDGPPLDKTTIGKFQQLSEFQEQLRRRLEEVPDKLGPSCEASGHILRVAYAGCTHLNWVAFRNLSPGVIAAAVASDELRGSSALSLCVDGMLEGDEGDLSDLAAALAQFTALKQLCFLQRPDRHSDDASARFCTQLLRSSGGGSSWLRDRIIYPTCAFSASLGKRKFTWPSTTTTTTTRSPSTPVVVVQVFPVMHLFVFVDQLKDEHQGSYYYDMGNTLLAPERFAVRFLSFLRSVGSGSGSEKSILRFAHGDGGDSSPLTASTTTDDKSAPPSSSGRFAVSPIPAGFFGNRVANDGESRVRVKNMHPDSWVVLLDQRDSSRDDDVFLRYSFVRIRPTTSEVAPEQKQGPVPELVKVVGGLTEFLRETVPGIDISVWERRVEEAEKDILRARALASMKKTEGKRCIGTGIGIGIMAESGARSLLNLD